MNFFLNKQKGKLIFIAVIVLLLLFLISSKLLKSYKSLDEYDDSVLYNSKIVASSDKYAIGQKSKSGVLYTDILAKTDNGKWKPLKVQKDYDLKSFWIIDYNKKLNIIFYIFYIKESNISIIHVCNARGVYDSFDKAYDPINEIKDNRDSVFYEYEFVDDNENYIFNAFIKDFNSEGYILYLNGTAYPYSSWGSI